MNSYLEVDFVLLSVVVLGAVFTAHASVASAHGHLDTISTSSLYLAVTFAVTGLSFPSWCNDRSFGPDSADNLLGQVVDVPVAVHVKLLACWRKPVEFPQVQFLDKVYTPVVAVWCRWPDSAENCGCAAVAVS